MEGSKFNRKAPLTKAVLAILAGLYGTDASSQDIPQQPRMHSVAAPKNKEKLDFVQETLWFKSKLKEGKATPEELQRMESLVLSIHIPLDEKVNFLKTTLRYGGYYEKRMRSADFTEEEFSKILRLVSGVSSGLNFAYELNPDDPMFKHVFALKKLEDATRVMTLQRVPTKKGEEAMTQFCNGFLTFVRGDVYFVTAKHCIEGTTVEHLYRKSPNSDQAIRYIPPSEYAESKITSEDTLPIFSSDIKPHKALGRLVVSYSYGPRKVGDSHQKKVHFSFVLPQSEMLATMQFPGSLKRNPHIAHGLQFIKPFGESKIIRGTPDDVKALEASGSSGSIVAVDSETEAGVLVLGDYESQRILSIECEKLCYATGQVGSPVSLNALIQEDQTLRASGFIADVINNSTKSK